MELIAGPQQPGELQPPAAAAAAAAEGNSDENDQGGDGVSSSVG